MGCQDDQSAAESIRENPMLECELRRYPCTWGEVPEEIRDRGLRLAEVVSRFRVGGGTASDAAEILADLQSVTDVEQFEETVRFRLEGSGVFQVSAPDELDHHRGDPASIPRDSVQQTAASLSRGTNDSLTEPFAVPFQRNTGRSTLAMAAAGLGIVGAAPVLASVSYLGTEEERQGVAAEEAGTPKKALVVAPYEWEFFGEASSFARDVRDIRDYDPRNQGTVELWANLREWDDNPPEPDRYLYGPRGDQPDEPPLLRGEVRPAHFLDWDDYNLVIVTSHGSAWPCPWASERVRRHSARGSEWYHFIVGQPDHPEICPQIWGHRALSDDYSGWVGLVIDVGAVRAPVPAPELTAEQARSCATRIAEGEESPVLQVGSETQACINELNRRPIRRLIYRFEFFQHYYPSGLNNTVVFIGACRSGLNHYLLDQLSGVPPGQGPLQSTNENVAAFGFDTSVDAGPAWALATEFIRLVDKGFHSAELLNRLSELDTTGHLVGRSLAPGDDPVDPDAQIMERESLKTHPRDVVLLIDPVTGLELEDSATVRVDGVAGDGEPDRLRIHPQLIGVADEEAPPELSLQVRVGGEEFPDESYVPWREVEEGAYRHEGDVTLGRDHTTGEIVDLEVRVELPGRRESKWLYRDVTLVGPCYWSASISGPGVNRSVRASWGSADTIRTTEFMDMDPPTFVLDGDPQPENPWTAIDLLSVGRYPPVSDTEAWDDLTSFRLLVPALPPGEVGSFTRVWGSLGIGETNYSGNADYLRRDLVGIPGGSPIGHLLTTNVTITQNDSVRVAGRFDGRFLDLERFESLHWSEQIPQGVGIHSLSNAQITAQGEFSMLRDGSCGVKVGRLGGRRR